MTFVLDKGECLDYSETRSKIHRANYTTLQELYEHIH
jgi:hypothetical protein